MAMKPSWMTDKKARFDETPWCLIRRPFNGQVLWSAVIKTWQNDPAKDYARWMVKTWVGDRQEPELWDAGDEYCRLLLQGELVEVLGQEPTLEQRQEWAVLERRAIAGPDAFAEWGM